MRLKALETYRCPVTGAALSFDEKAGVLRAPDGHSYPIADDIVDFSAGLTLNPADQQARDGYNSFSGEFYENAMNWLWQTYREDEATVRNGVIDQLEVAPGQQVLEIGCGTGADSAIIAGRMTGGAFYLQEISPGMIAICRQRLGADNGRGTVLEYSIGETARLPFADRSFDRAFHFGGLNAFSDIPGALREMARVTKIGGIVVVGDEAVAPWLRGEEYGRILVENNPAFDAAAPLEKLPVGARDVSLRYIIGNSFYVMRFSVGDGPPDIDLDVPHKGSRGGTMRTRYFGRLEGVSPEARRLAIAAARQEGKSLHAWLDEAVRSKAQKPGDKDG